MRVPCQRFSNNARLAIVLASLAEEPCFQLICLDGIITQDGCKFKVVSDTVTALVSYISSETRKSLFCVLTTDPELSFSEPRKVETNNIISNSAMFNLCTLLMDKYRVTQNNFAIELNGEGEGVTIAPLQDGDDSSDVLMSCNISGQAGDVMILNETVIREVLAKCTAPKSFTFTSVSPDIDKTVTVKRPYGEIYKEVARYLGKTLVLVEFTQNNEFFEQYISSSGILECFTTRQGVKRFKKVAPNAARKTTPFNIRLTSSSIEEVARLQGKSLQKAVK